jgi:hypothetical protein
MQKIKILVLNLSILLLGGMTVGTNPVIAQNAVNQSDTTGIIIEPPPVVDTSNFSGGGQAGYDPTTGTIDLAELGGELGELFIDPDIFLLDANGEGLTPGDVNTGNTEADGSGGDSDDTNSASESQKVSINDVAELLETDLNQSLEDLATAEKAQETASEQPRRIARNRLARRASNNCLDPTVEARAEVEKKLEQAQKFIKAIDSIQPGNAIW